MKLFPVVLVCTLACTPSLPHQPWRAEANGSCDPLFGHDSVLLAPADPRGYSDSGLIVIAKREGARWRPCGVPQ